MKKILVLDDDSMILKSLKRFLEDRDFTVDTYQDGWKALEALRICEYSCIVSDIDMPSMSGLEFLQKVHTENPEMAGHFIFYSGNPVPPPNGTLKASKGQLKELLGLIQLVVSG